MFRNAPLVVDLFGRLWKRFPFAFFFYNYGEGAEARRLRRVSSMDMVSEWFILEYEVRDSIFFLSMIPCVLCVKCGRVFRCPRLFVILSFI